MRLLCAALVLVWVGLSTVCAQTVNRQPVVSSPIYVFTEDEEQPAGTILDQGLPGGRLQATDPDGDPVTFLIPANSINSQYFNINATSGELSFAVTLNREAVAPDNAALQLFVEVSDGVFHGVGVTNPRIEVRILLNDINDEVPTFTNLPATIDVPEDMDVGSRLFIAMATDMDFGANAQIEFVLQAVNGENCDSSPGGFCDFFSIGLATGDVMLEEALNFDLPAGRRTHTVSIRAQDAGSTPLSRVRDLTVTVTDVNDLNPAFSLSNYFVEVHENLTFGDVVTTVVAFDQDVGIMDNILYSITDGNAPINGTASFAINQTTGEIYVNTPVLDRETHASYQLIVGAVEESDSARFASSRVSITVFDINDHAPFFGQQLYAMNVSETLPVDSVALTVTAQDRDHGTNAEFEFRLQNSVNESLPFRISHDAGSGLGRILINESLDFEEDEQYTFFVFATELVQGSPMSGVTTVTVTVINENDNSPVFGNASYAACVPENANPGAFVEMVSAMDGDAGLFGEVTYALSGPGSEDFNITMEMGRIETAVRLDHEGVSEYELMVEAVDRDPIPRTRRSERVPLTVCVINLNDNPPQFMEPMPRPQVFVTEERPAPHVAYTFTVEDADGDLNTLILDIIEGNSQGLFDTDGLNLVTTEMLDFDLSANRTYTLTVRVNDSVHTDTITLDIHVVDINDNTPAFPQPYSLSVYEGEAVGSLVGRVTAEDADSGTFGQVVYSLAGPGANSFTVNGSTGEVRTAVVLDRESRPQAFNLTVFATDQDGNPANRNTGSTPLTITTLDRNDNTPLFDQTRYSFSVLENTDFLNPAVFVVMATDADLGNNSEVFYFIRDGNVDNVFVIDPRSGVIGRNISVYLDRERTSRYTLTVVARDNGDSPNETPVQVSVDIEDENDVTPTFDLPQFESTIREDMDSGTIVRQLVARDGDADVNGQLTYSISSVSGPTPRADAPTGSFTIDAALGTVRTSGTFDREAFEGPYTVIVSVRDGGFPLRRSSSTTLLVFISDANDNRPVFQEDQYSNSLSENLPAGQLVAMVTATDIDMMGSNNSAIVYSVTRVLVGGAVSNTNSFTINGTSGRLTTTAPLDYEQVQSYTITVEASDRGQPQRSSNAIVLLTVVDENDQGPEFTEPSYTIPVPEDTPINTRFTSISASDEDTPPNDIIQYSSSLASPFFIDPMTGELVLTSTLDYESVTEYVFNVTATNDAGGVVFTDTSDVRVMVIDVNDRSPVFSQPSYSVAVDEGNYTGSPQPLPLTLEAMDADSGALGEVTFELLLPEQDSDLWAVRTVGNGRGELVAIGFLDRETTSSYMIRVLARDGGIPAATATTIIRVTVNDVNDIAPMLSQQAYTATIPENNTPGEAVARVTVTDGDEGVNGEVVLQLSDSTHFTIDPSGEIRTRTSFNYESMTSFSLFISARDNAPIGQRLTSTALFLVNITDVNDNRPQFQTTPTQQNVAENVAVGTTIAELSATDLDSGSNGQIVYTLTGGEGRFAVDGSGTVTVTKPLDRESRASYSLTVHASDRGQPHLTDTVVIPLTIIDVNDVPPEFQRDLYNFAVDEELPVGRTIGSILAIDTDSPANRATTMDIVSGDTKQFSVATRTLDSLIYGDIITAGVLDYETQASYPLRVRARNTAAPNLESYTNITVSLRDLNDNSPIFSMLRYTFSISESAPPTTPVGTVVATDDDGGLSGQVEYRLADSVDSNIRSLFTIGLGTGVLSLTQTLDYEANSSYSFIVIATDRSVTPRTTPVSVTVMVQDTNENAPEFGQASYVGTVRENLPQGSPVTLPNPINATEQDGTSILYSIAAGGLGRFAIGPTSGQLTTLQPLDREQQDRYILTIQARDTSPDSLSSFTQVEITVEDVNDERPVFQEPLQFSLREDTPTNSLVGTLTAYDRDAGVNREIIFSSLSSGPFTVRDNGDIFVSAGSAIDFETTPIYTIVVMATDSAIAGSEMSSSATVTISLLDINDNDPAFTQPTYSVSVRENSDVGVSVLTVVANDNDGDTPLYSILSGDLGSKFSLDPMTGLIQTTVNRIDREAPNEQLFTLRVQADDQRGRSSVATVRVTVVDENDHAPICDMNPFMFEVPEANNNPVRLGQLTASDSDSGVNANVVFGMISGDLDGVFSVNSEGELTASERLDFETTPTYSLGVGAMDQSADPTERMTTVCSVEVTVRDVNDNRPLFEDALYEATVIENATLGTFITTVTADDSDSGLNGEFFYHFQSPIREFGIDSMSGVVTVTGSLDAESQPLYTLVVEARDRGSPTQIGQAMLVVRVLDINDNAPRFDSSFFTVSIPEDRAVNSDVVTLEANDPDSVDLTYSIESGNQGLYFSINPRTGLIQTARSLDRETVAVFSLQVAASDPSGNMGSTTLQIRVLDVNDEAPQFLQPSYTARVTENSPRGTQVLPVVNGSTIRIEAFDSDEPNTQNSRVLYSLEGPNADLFDIDFNTGIVTVAPGASLDAEAQNMLSVTVVASDSVVAPNTRSSTVELLVSVLDVNDVRPRFTQPFGYAIPVSENVSVSSVITDRVRANDPDGGLGGVVRYSLTGATPLVALSWFSIDPVSGDLRLEQNLDRERNSIITLTVTASDQGSPALMSIVTVQLTISDVNDNPPRFSEGVYSESVPEFLAVGSSAGRVSASDPDVGSNAEVRYRVTPPSDRFTVNPSSGVITTTGPLDHETQAQFTLTIEACDRGDIVMCSSARVIITVLDFNDEPPMFDLTLYTVDVCENTTIGTPLVRPVATDRDSGTNAQLDYRLTGDNWGLFTIDGTIGLVTLQRDIDSLDVTQGVYQLTVVATDNGATPLSGTADIRLQVLNCTERQFQFVRPFNYLEIEEGSGSFLTPSPTNLATIDIVGTVLASSFQPDYPSNPFTAVNNRVGLKSMTELTAIGVGQGVGLDREVRGLYTVILTATDNSNPPLTAYASVTVQVLDINDNDPTFDPAFYSFTVSENLPAPLTVGSISASDRDIGVYGSFNYSIEPSLTSTPYPFTVDPYTGVITTTTVLDRETTPQYNLTVVATDGTGRSGRSEVVVVVEDVNDCPPTFTPPQYTVPVSENISPGTSVAMVTATDCDLGDNGLVRYSIVGGDVGVFILDMESGVIRTLIPLDFETIQTYSLTVRAVDMGVSLLTGDAVVTIEVEDFNDCAPEFVATPTTHTIGEDQVSGSILVTFTVSDCDSGLNGVNGTRFSIIAGNIDGLFSLSAQSGVLVTTGPLDRETTPTYLLSIQAQDSAGVNSLSSVTQLSITVGDVNDNEPEFDEPIIFETLSESEDSNPVFTFTATDADAGLNGDILYSLRDGFGVFDIEESTGAISLVTTLDRETTPTYNLTVMARDRGVTPRTSELVIVVDVRDVNDNAPTILNVTSGVTMATVIEGQVIGSQVFVVAASDPDLGMNGEVSFSLEDLSPDLPFEISPAGGVISVSGELDYEEQNEYTVVVVATDNGFPRRLTSVATLTISVIDSNDNPPEFTSDVYEGSQQEGVAMGTSILTVLARDADQTGSVNALVEYSLVGGDVDQFTIHPSTGIISNSMVLDRENQSMYSVRVLANNSQSHTPLTSTATVRIVVSDVNDETPTFTQSFYRLSLSELTPTGAPLNLIVVATDNDAPNTPNSALIYSLARQTDNPFSVDPDTGEVLLLNSLDFESTNSYDLTLVVQDKGTPNTLSSQARLLILVSDENDVMPSFTRQTYSMEVSEGEDSFPHRVANLAYTDGDTLAQFRQSTFSILAVQPPSPGLFRVETDADSETGAVFIERAVDYELETTYTLTLSVENLVNGAGPQCQSGSVCTFSQTATLEVTIGDENDNAPVFTRDLYTGEVSSTASTGTSVLSVTAEDADAGPITGNVRYALQSSITLPFRVDESSGTVLTRGLLTDIPSGSSFTLRVSAMDNEGQVPTNMALTTVRIVVLDDFDRIAFDFSSSVDCVVANELRFAEYLANITGYSITIESYLEYATDVNSLFIIHANDENQVIVDFAQFSDRLRGRETELFSMFRVCNLTRIISFAEAEEPYQYPPLVDTQTIVILVLCLLLIVGSAILLVMALTQRYLALNNARHKLLADVFYGGSPGGGSVVESQPGENYQLESLELTGKAVNRQNPMFVHPYDNWTGVDTSGVDPESVAEAASSLNKDNPLYESQEIRMEMFADVQSEEDEADDTELLAQALADDDSDDDDDDDDDENAITAI